VGECECGPAKAHKSRLSHLSFAGWRQGNPFAIQFIDAAHINIYFYVPPPAPLTPRRGIIIIFMRAS